MSLLDPSLLLKLGAFSLTLACSFCWLLFHFQDRLIYIPCSAGSSRNMSQNAHGYRYPSDRLLSYKDVYVKTADGLLLHGWLIFRRNLPVSPVAREPLREVEFCAAAAAAAPDADDDARPARPSAQARQRQVDAARFASRTVVFFHENSGNLGLRLKYFEEYVDRVDCNLLAVAYRGYSLSEGVPTEAALKSDALRLLDWVFAEQRLFDPAKALFHGRSLGSAVLLHALAHSPHARLVSKAVVECAFTSLGDVVQLLLPRVGRLRRLLLRNQWDNLAEVRRLPGHLQVLFVAGGRDKLTPAAMTRWLHTAFTGDRKALVVIAEGDHNQPYLFDAALYFGSIKELLSL